MPTPALFASDPAEGFVAFSIRGGQAQRCRSVRAQRERPRTGVVAPLLSRESERQPGGGVALLLSHLRGDPPAADRQAERDRSRTISAAPHPRAARPLWFESGRRGGVRDLGGGGQPTAEASAASASRSPLARTRNVAGALVRPNVRQHESDHQVDAHFPRLARLSPRDPRCSWRSGCRTCRSVACWALIDSG